MTNSTTSRFYVYILVRPDGRPFYIGKGKGYRIYEHDKEARNGHQCHKCNLIRKIWEQGKQFQRYFVLETDNEQEALDYEVELIALYGKETLTNLTDGGEGLSGLPMSAKNIERLRQLNTGRVVSPETRARISAAQKARYADPAARAKASEVARKSSTPEGRERQAAKLRGRTLSAETRAKIGVAGKGRYTQAQRDAQMRRAPVSDETKAKMSAATRGKKQTASTIAAVIESNRRRAGTKRGPMPLEWRAKISATKRRQREERLASEN